MQLKLQDWRAAIKMIPQNILEPKGCNNLMRKDSFDLKIICGKYNNFCPSCKSSRKAVIKALIDKKREEAKFLRGQYECCDIDDFENASACQRCIERKNKLKELTQEINTLEGLE